MKMCLWQMTLSRRQLRTSQPKEIDKWFVTALTLALVLQAGRSALAAEDMTFLIWVIFRMAPFLGGNESLLERKKCPPARLRTLGSQR